MIESSRNYVEIIVEGIMFSEGIASVFEKHGQGISRLQIKYIRFSNDEVHFILRIFNALPKLRKIFFESTTTDEDAQNWIENISGRVNLKHLKEIVATETDYRVRFCLSNFCFVTFTKYFINSRSYPYSTQLKSFL
jgi:hypothetical protein